MYAWKMLPAFAGFLGSIMHSPQARHAKRWWDCRGSAVRGRTMAWVPQVRISLRLAPSKTGCYILLYEWTRCSRGIADVDSGDELTSDRPPTSSDRFYWNSCCCCCCYCSGKIVKQIICVLVFFIALITRPTLVQFQSAKQRV